VRSCLVSDFPARSPAPSAGDIAAGFRDYLALLDRAGLRVFFEPVDKRVTLSLQAGAMKPERAIFELALRRLGSRAQLDECLLVTENAAHVTQARRRYAMATLRFRAAGAKRFDFDDWAQAPALIARMLGARSAANMRQAVRAFLAAQRIDLEADEGIGADGQGPFSGSRWTPLSIPGTADHGERRVLQGLHVAVPASGRIERDRKGLLRLTGVEPPTVEALQETASFVRSLAAHGQIAGLGGGTTRARSPLPLLPTHEIRTDAAGERRLVRRGYTAI
jgi:hypothetical protein